MEIYQQRHSSHFQLLSLLLLCCTGGQCLTVKASVGGDAVLPCHVVDAAELPVEWTRTPSLPDDQFVFLWRNGGPDSNGQNPSYKDRTSLSQDEVVKGNVSLKLTRVKPSDEGNYTCHILGIGKKSTVQLAVEPRRVSVKEGEDVIISCQTNVPVDGSTVDWRKADLTPQHVHVIRDGHEESALQNSVYRDRTSVSVDRVKDGDVSLTISAVQLSDDGLYTCFIKSVTECIVQLTVAISTVQHNAATAIISAIIIVIIISAFTGIFVFCLIARKQQCNQACLVTKEAVEASYNPIVDDNDSQGLNDGEDSGDNLSVTSILVALP